MDITSNLLLIASLLIFDGYLIIRYFQKKGISRSISRTYYELNKKWIFMVYQIAFSVLMILTLESHFITMSGSFIIFSALAADTKADDDVETIHIIGAIGGIALGMAAMIEFGFWWIPAVFVPLAYISMKVPVKNHTYWIEVLAFHLVVFGLFLN